MNVSEAVGNEFTVHTCDQVIYDIALGLKTKKKEKYKKLILRLGGFHIAMNYKKSIAFVMKDTGLEENLLQGKVCTSGIANMYVPVV